MIRLEEKTIDNEIEDGGRRNFLQGLVSAGAFVLCVGKTPLLAKTARNGAPRASLGAPPSIDATPFHPGVYVGIQSDGTVLIVAHRVEMGNGVRTSLPRILADELDADWTRVKVVQGDGDEKYGDQDTDGSHSVRSFFDSLREAGATARLMLVRAAARQWGVPESECVADPPHAVSHKTSNRTLGYGELAELAAKQPVPKKEELKFKSRQEWRYIGKPAPGYDVTDICAGKAQFGMDVRIDGMLYAAVAHPPVLGGKVKSVDNSAALKVTGVQKTIPIDPFTPPHAFQPLGGVAVIADNTWSAFKGRRQLKIEWDNGANTSYTSADYKKQLQETARQPGKVIRTMGDPDAEFAKGAKVFEAEYFAPHLAHASMEPPVAVADVKATKATVWTCTQNPMAVREEVAKALGLKKEDVTCHVTLLGGGFGRKSKPDYCVEAALLSKKTGKAVKVVWSREDDIQFDYYHSVAAMYIKAALDDKGMPKAWLQRSVFPPIASTFDKTAVYGDEVSLGWDVTPFALANFRSENGPATAHVRIGWLRSVANIYHAFAVQTFANELAYAANRDPYDYLLDLIGPGQTIDVKDPDEPEIAKKYPYDTGRLRRVAELAAEKAGWGKKKSGNGWGMGIAAHRSFLTYVATVVEVEVDKSGTIRIPNVYTAVDAGTVVNPDMVRSQFQGAAVFGTSIARYGEITASNGVIDQSNFNDYPVARMNDAPVHTDVQIVESAAPPAGVGEPGVPPFVPAMCNAVYAATGKRVRELPLSRNGFA
ncbi:MAG TPA: molybdopterin cofactor-binding domain-containing protein [Candidatus Sulfotelmatobacter sp.]|jgi:isoquinoline 1-oxidoreductase beta subunit|nr:molybdopterin cofactor-binding domain-containing protein [Candidatus Sulfotelmatobacter sp.]